MPDALLEGGAELELGWLPPLLDGARNSKLEAGKPGHIYASEGVSLLEVPSTLDRSKGDVHAAGNPHYHVRSGQRQTRRGTYRQKPSASSTQSPAITITKTQGL